MKYIVTVTQEEIVITGPEAGSPDAAVGETRSTQEVFRQSFDELDLGKLAIALNTKPRGRPAKKKEGAT